MKSIQVAEQSRDLSRRVLQPSVACLAFDIASWGIKEHRAAAAVLGHHAARLLELVGRRGPTWDQSEAGRGRIDEAICEAFDLASQAAFFARQAIDIEELELQTLGQTVR